MTTLVQPLRALSERTGSFDHDIEAVAFAFGAVEPRVTPHDLREPVEVADEQLQFRLEVLCEALRAKY